MFSCNSESIEALSKLNRITGLSPEEIIEFALEEGVRLTGSSTGYLAFVNEDGSLLTMHFWPGETAEKCAAGDETIQNPTDKTGLWGEAVRQKRPVITNDFEDPDLPKGYPVGHDSSRRHLSVPLFDGDRLVLVAGLGNKKDNYNESDVYLLALLMSLMWRFIQQKKAEKAHQDSEKRLRSITDNMQDIICQTAEGILQYVSPSCKDILGYEPGDLLGKHIFDLIHPDDLNNAVATYQTGFSTCSAGRLELRFLHAKGHFAWLETIGSPLSDDNGIISGAIWCSRDISDRKHAGEQLEYLSLHDPITGIFNRTFFEQEMIRLGEEMYTPVGIILCDVDGLKLVNDTMGHNTGDELLAAAASVLKGSFREGDMVARIGGDEFAILLPKNEKINVENAVRRIRSNIARYNAKSPKFPLSISIGFAVRNDVNIVMSDIFKEADNNMYREKLNSSQTARSAIIQTLMKKLEARDFVAEGHADRLQELVVEFATALGMPERSITDLRLLAQFRDIGKVSIPDRILFKPGPLSPEEVLEMQRHCEIGHRTAQSTPDLILIADLILKHHEWWNGKGYPLRLKGEEIPTECLIMAIADAYHAMTNDRPYRKALSQEEAVAELKRCAGTQFDPNFVSIFTWVLEKKRQVS
ncbi:MAG: diguanylate cyclase domain-containing protein [Eubacteriales bacterium]